MPVLKIGFFFLTVSRPHSLLLIYSGSVAESQIVSEWDVSFIDHALPFVFQVDFANRESQLAFYHSMEKTGQDIRDFYEMLAERRHVSNTPIPFSCFSNAILNVVKTGGQN